MPYENSEMRELEITVGAVVWLSNLSKVKTFTECKLSGMSFLISSRKHSQLFFN